MKYEDIDTGISRAEGDPDKACPECGEMGVTGNGVCISCLIKIARYEPMKSIDGMKAQIHILETQEKTRRNMIGSIGHNSDKFIDAAVQHARDEKPLDNSVGISGERLRSIIQRIEKMEEDKAAIMEDLKDIYAEAKGTGYDARVIRKIVALRKIEVSKRRETNELMDLYMSAIGMED